MYGSEVIVLALYDLVLVEIKRIKCGLVYGSVISRVVQVVYREGGIGRIVYMSDYTGFILKVEKREC